MAHSSGQSANRGHSLKPEVVAALEDFLSGAGKIPGINIDIDGIFDSRRNAIQGAKSEKKNGSAKAEGVTEKTGTSVIIQVDGGNGLPVTSYSLAPPALGGADSNARSLRLRQSGVTTGRPQEGVAGVQKRRDIGERIERGFARTVNSMSFGWMFSDDDPDDHMAAGSKEQDTVSACLDVLGTDGADALRRVVHGERVDAGGTSLDGSDPCVRMGAWETMHIGGKAFDSFFPGLSDMARNDAAAAMGLDALKDALERTARDASSGKDCTLADYLDPSAEDGRDALRGLACLCYYKAVRKESEIWADKSGEKHVELIPGKESVFLRGAFARSDASNRLRDGKLARDGFSDGAAYACYPKVAASRATGNLKDERINASQEYRFYRCAVLGENPDMPSGAACLKLTYKGDIRDSKAKADAGKIYIEDPSNPSARPVLLSTALDNDYNGRGEPLLESFPAIRALARAKKRIDPAMDLACKLVKADYSIGPDMAELDIAAYSEMSKAGMLGPATVNKIRAMESSYQAARRERIGSNPVYWFAYDHAAGYPDFSAGRDGFGDLVTANARQLDARDPVFVPAGSVLAATEGRLAGHARAARSFRTVDAERQLIAAHASLPSDAKGWAEATNRQGPFDMAGMYVNALAKSSRPAMRNDIMVLTETYLPRTPDAMERLLSDAENAYHSDTEPGDALYRPMNAIEANAIRGCVKNNPGAWPVVSASEQGTRGGFIRAVREAAADGDLGPAKKALLSGALDHDTLQDTTYADMAAELDPPAEPTAGQKAVARMRAAMPGSGVTDMAQERKSIAE